LIQLLTVNKDINTRAYPSEREMEQDSERAASPNWVDLMHEEVIEPVEQQLLQGNTLQAETTMEKGSYENMAEDKTEGLVVIQSERIKKQGMEGVKIVDKEDIAIKKKNMEGNIINLRTPLQF
jgi:hypothetical protein